MATPEEAITNLRDTVIDQAVVIKDIRSLNERIVAEATGKIKARDAEIAALKAKVAELTTPKDQPALAAEALAS